MDHQGRQARQLLATLLALALLGLQARGQRSKTDFGDCYRDCTADPSPRECYFNFVEEIYAVNTGACKNCTLGVEQDCDSEQCIPTDGVERSVYSINRQLPGPCIQVCEGDQVIVDLVVDMTGHADTIHWHGITQRGTPWYDGVAWVTQCPVLFGNRFRYNFRAEPYGTHFYHSHSGVHKVNGIFGCLIVRQSRYRDLQTSLYDYDLPQHVVLLNDWSHVDAEFVLPGLANRITGQPADGLLCNGKGQYTNPESLNTTLTPLARFEVRFGYRYRFRIINSGSLSCPIVVQFEGHSMLVIATDGHDIVPYRADTLYTFSGERWDVVVEANATSAKEFWMYFRTRGICQRNGGSEQKAILVYSGSNVSRPPTSPPGILLGKQYPDGTVVNSPGDCAGASQVCAGELVARRPAEFCTDPSCRPHAVIFFDLKFVVLQPNLLFQSKDYNPFLAFSRTNLAAALNNISYTPPSAPFLTQPRQAQGCQVGRLPDTCQPGQLCYCAHRVVVPKDAIVEIVVVDTSDTNRGDNSTTLLAHPMHLHGMSFVVMAQGTLRNETNGVRRSRRVRRMYEAGRLRPAVAHPIKKDVLVLPGGGYIVLRFLADNPGAWFFHCHFQYHMAAGMEAVIQVGETEHFPKPPPGFPTCGDYAPDLDPQPHDGHYENEYDDYENDGYY